RTEQGIPYGNGSKRKDLETGNNHDQRTDKQPKLTGVGLLFFGGNGKMFPVPDKKPGGQGGKEQQVQYQLPRHPQIGKGMDRCFPQDAASGEKGCVQYQDITRNGQDQGGRI